MGRRRCDAARVRPGVRALRAAPRRETTRGSSRARNPAPKRRAMRSGVPNPESPLLRLPARTPLGQGGTERTTTRWRWHGRAASNGPPRAGRAEPAHSRSPARRRPIASCAPSRTPLGTRGTHGVRDCLGRTGPGRAPGRCRATAAPGNRADGCRATWRRRGPTPVPSVRVVRLPARVPWEPEPPATRSIRTSRSRALRASLALRAASASTRALTAAICALSMKRSSWSCSRVWRNRVLNSAFSRGSADATRTVPALFSQP